MSEHHHLHGPSHAGSVVLEMGGDIGILILEAPPELNGHEIEISPAGGSDDVPRTHSMVRERITAVGVSYAALYVSVPAGPHTVWRDACTPAGTVMVRGGEISHFSWEPAADTHAV